MTWGFCHLTCGIKLTWMLQKFSLFTLNWNCLKASMKGMLSMSPTVPPSCWHTTTAQTTAGLRKTTQPLEHPWSSLGKGSSSSSELAQIYATGTEKGVIHLCLQFKAYNVNFISYVIFFHCILALDFHHWARRFILKNTYTLSSSLWHRTSFTKKQVLIKGSLHWLLCANVCWCSLISCCEFRSDLFYLSHMQQRKIVKWRS